MWKKSGIVFSFALVLIAPAILAFAPTTTRSPTWSPTVLCATGVDESCDVAVFGGGFGGLYTALALASQARSKGQRLEVILVDPSDRFVFLPLLYDLVVGTGKF
jgi:NADPH-dependent 2,4-dienoyl-CoA reductase/sulfur reductase-like enzyme